MVQPDQHDPPAAQGYTSCQESDNALSHHVHPRPSIMETAPCQESKMDSPGTHSEPSHVATEATVETSSTFIAAHDASPTSSPKTVQKKKGGRKRQEVRGL